MKRYSVFDLYYEANRDGANIEVIKASEVDAEIAELVEMLENVLEGQSHDYPRTYLDLEIKELINKHKNKEG